jgi:hypothetical protein
MFLSGATQATLTEPASLTGVFVGCLGVFPCGGSSPFEAFSIRTGSMEFSVSLDGRLPFGGYIVTSQVYTISTAEPGTGLLLCPEWDCYSD